MKEKIIIALVVALVVVGGAIYLEKLPNPFNKTGKADLIVVPENNGQEIVSVGNIVGSMKSASVGEYLTDTKGRTLYTFGDDEKLQSACAGDCLNKWPIYEYDSKDVQASTDFLSKRMNVIKRKDGAYQYAYGEKPVYYYIGDKNPGETNGMSGTNIGSRWSLVLIQR